jgi:hypothetical protein
VPLQLERRRQSVDTFIQQLHHAIVAAIDVDFANPDRPRGFNVHESVGCSYCGAAHPSKTFSHTLKKPRPIVIPLIAIVFANEFRNSVPISAIDRVKKMLCVKANLMLGPPKPKQIEPNREYNRQ